MSRRLPPPIHFRATATLSLVALVLLPGPFASAQSPGGVAAPAAPVRSVSGTVELSECRSNDPRPIMCRAVRLIDPDGRVQWTTRLPNVYLNSIAATSPGAIVVAGWFSASPYGQEPAAESFASVAIHGRSVRSRGPASTIAAGLSADGEVLWMEALGGSGDCGGDYVERPTDVLVDSRGGVYVSGVYCGVGLYLEAALPHTSGGWAYLARLDPNGRLRWIRAVIDQSGMSNGRRADWEFLGEATDGTVVVGRRYEEPAAVFRVSSEGDTYGAEGSEPTVWALTTSSATGVDPGPASLDFLLGSGNEYAMAGDLRPPVSQGKPVDYMLIAHYRGYHFSHALLSLVRVTQSVPGADSVEPDVLASYGVWSSNRIHGTGASLGAGVLTGSHAEDFARYTDGLVVHLAALDTAEAKALLLSGRTTAVNMFHIDATQRDALLSAFATAAMEAPVALGDPADARGWWNLMQSANDRLRKLLSVVGVSYGEPYGEVTPYGAFSFLCCQEVVAMTEVADWMSGSSVYDYRVTRRDGFSGPMNEHGAHGAGDVRLKGRRTVYPGFGVVRWREYAGNFVDGVFEGHGALTFDVERHVTIPDGGCVRYEGNFVRGAPNGYGSLVPCRGLGDGSEEWMEAHGRFVEGVLKDGTIVRHDGGDVRQVDVYNDRARLQSVYYHSSGNPRLATDYTTGVTRHFLYDGIVTGPDGVPIRHRQFGTVEKIGDDVWEHRGMSPIDQWGRGNLMYIYEGEPPSSYEDVFERGKPVRRSIRYPNGDVEVLVGDKRSYHYSNGSQVTSDYGYTGRLVSETRMHDDCFMEDMQLRIGDVCGTHLYSYKEVGPKGKYTFIEESKARWEGEFWHGEFTSGPVVYYGVDGRRHEAELRVETDGTMRVTWTEYVRKEPRGGGLGRMLGTVGTAIGYAAATWICGPGAPICTAAVAGAGGAAGSLAGSAIEGEPSAYIGTGPIGFGPATSSGVDQVGPDAAASDGRTPAALIGLPGPLYEIVRRLVREALTDQVRESLTSTDLNVGEEEMLDQLFGQWVAEEVRRRTGRSVSEGAVLPGSRFRPHQEVVAELADRVLAHEEFRKWKENSWPPGVVLNPAACSPGEACLRAVAPE